MKLHLWIDLNFGYRLGQNNTLINSATNTNRNIFTYSNLSNLANGVALHNIDDNDDFSIPSISNIDAAINSKNVPLQFDPLLARHTGVIQLFNEPHPPQLGYDKLYNPLADLQFLYHQQSMQIQRRIYEFGNDFLKLYSCTTSPESLGFVLTDKDNTLHSSSFRNGTASATSQHQHGNMLSNEDNNGMDKIQSQLQSATSSTKSKKHHRSPAIKIADRDKQNHLINIKSNVQYYSLMIMIILFPMEVKIMMKQKQYQHQHPKVVHVNVSNTKIYVITLSR